MARFSIWSSFALLLPLIVISSCGTHIENGYQTSVVSNEIVPRFVTDVIFQANYCHVSSDSVTVSIRLNFKDFLPIKTAQDKWEATVQINIKGEEMGWFNKAEFETDSVVLLQTDEIVYLSKTLPRFAEAWKIEVKVIDQSKHVYSLVHWIVEPIASEIARWGIVEKGVHKPERIFVGELPQIIGEIDSNQLYFVEVYKAVFEPSTSLTQIREFTKKPMLDSVHEIYGRKLNLWFLAQNNVYLRILNDKSAKKALLECSKIDRDLTQNALCYLLSYSENENNLPVTAQQWSTYWYKAAKGDEYEKSRLIADFLDRIHTANSLFSSYKMGWQTDRGMIYLLFGKPDRIEPSFSGETWQYGFTGLDNRVFQFDKNPHNMNANDYVLNWLPAQRNMEQDAQYRWQNGWTPKRY